MTRSACGKVILLGEHAVVYGSDALAMSLDRGVSIVASPDNRYVLHVPQWQTIVRPDGPSEMSLALQALIDACPTSSPQRLEARMQIPAGAGLGCSAALGTAIAKVLLGERGEPEAIFEAAQAWECVFHGTPSGIDAWAAQGMGAFVFARGSKPRLLHGREALHFVICHSGETGSTKEMVARVAEQRERDPTARALVTHIATLVGRGAAAFERGAAAELGATFTENQAALRRLGVSTRPLEELCETLQKLGALGAKLTGSGGGGCALGVFGSRSEADAAVDALQRTHEFCFALSSHKMDTVHGDE